MESVAIGLRESGEVRAALTAALQPLVSGGALVRLEEQRRGDMRFLGCRLESDAGLPGAARAFRQAVATAVAAWIVGDHEFRLLRRLVGSRYAYFNEGDRARILAFAQRQLIESAGGASGAVAAGGGDADAGGGTAQRCAEAGHAGHAGGAGSAGLPVCGPPQAAPTEAARRSRAVGSVTGGAGVRARRQVYIQQRLADYLQRHDSVVVDGFVTFRLKDYVEELALAVDRAVEDFLLEREYREFIGLLRHFVTNHAERPTVAECILAADGMFRLEDERGRVLAPDVVDDLAMGPGRGEVAPEDLVVSALITVAPRRVRLHLPDGATPLSGDAIDSLREVFFGQVDICAGCSRCRPHFSARDGAGG